MSALLVAGGVTVLGTAALVARGWRAAGIEDRRFEEARIALDGVLVSGWDTRAIRPFALRWLVGPSRALEDLATRAPAWIVRAAVEWQELSPVGVRCVIAGDRAVLVARTRAGGIRGKLAVRKGDSVIEEALVPEEGAPPRDVGERLAALAARA